MSSYPSQSDKSPVRALVGGGVVLALAVAFWAWYRSSGPSALPQPSAAEFREELAAIRPPEGAVPQGPTDENVRIGSLILTNRYDLQQSAAEARAHYRTELAAHGWQLKGSSDEQPWSDSFCKGSTAAKVSLLREAPPTTSVALTLSWNETTLLKCGDGSAMSRPG